MKKPDWVIHLVCIESPAGFVGKILNLLCERVRYGETFNDGDMVSDILVGYDVKLRKMVEDGEELLRVMLPDEKGRFPGDIGCEPMFSMQDRPLAELKRYHVPKSGIDYSENIRS